MSDEQQVDNLTPSRARKKTLAAQKKFFDAYAECGIIKYACLAAGVTRQTFYNWRDNDEEFQRQFPDKKSDAVDTLEYAAYVQAVLGSEEPVISAGKLVYNDDGTPRMVRKYSPQLLITLLKANNPEKYKEKQQIEHSGPGGAPIQIQRNPQLSKLSDEELEALETLAQKALRGDEHNDNA